MQTLPEMVRHARKVRTRVNDAFVSMLPYAAFVHQRLVGSSFVTILHFVPLILLVEMSIFGSAIHR